uniref:Large ribosomal subunit protein mL52 n=1 Tax=Cacopsylla melanoneura TaxID=428564 RepID=A0A8D8XC03_9HEMI
MRQLSLFAKTFIQNGHLDASRIKHLQYKCLHTSQVVHDHPTAKKVQRKYYVKNDHYDEIKLKPFTQTKGVERWRTKYNLPHHVDSMKWKAKHGLPQDLNSCGPLTDNPDYSYVDETLVRPPPYGSGQRKRIMEQIEHAKTIVQFCKELDQGKQKYQDKLKAKEEEKDKIINSKLKPKGSEVLN